MTATTETKTARAQCRVLTTRGERCTGESIDDDPKTMNICLRHAGEVLELINERKKTART